VGVADDPLRLAGNEPRKALQGAAVQQLTRQRVSQIETPASCNYSRRFMPRCLPHGDELRERRDGVGEAPVIDGNALADEALNAVDDVPALGRSCPPRRDLRPARRR
jgi:hypothetical protein